MKGKKTAINILAASAVWGSVLGAGAAAVPAAEASTVNPQASFTNMDQQHANYILHTLYENAYLGKMPFEARNLKIGRNTKADVHKKLGEPPQPLSKNSQFDYYHAEMGHSGFAFSYDKKEKILEIRYFGTNVERDQNLGSITPEILSKEIGSADEILVVPGTSELDYIYRTGNYELHFVVGDKGTVNHVNLKRSSVISHDS